MKSVGAIWIFLLLVLLSTGRLQAQTRVMAEGSVTYKINAPASVSAETGNVLKSASYILSMKGSRVRTDFTCILGITTSIYSNTTHTGAMLQDYGQEKMLVSMTRDDFEDMSKEYKNATLSLSSDTATIAGYVCRKAITRLASGDTLLVWYSPDLVPQNKEYSYRFRDIPGLALQYESLMGKVKVVYTATRVSMDPLPSVRFDVPKTGYREMSYESAKKLK